LTAKLKRKLEYDPNMCLTENGGKLLSTPSSITEDNMVIYEFKDRRELINKVEFTLNVAQGYALDSSFDGINWTLIVEFPDMVCRGRQIVYFKKTKMRYLRIKLKVYTGFFWINVRDGDVVAVLDTTTGVRKNQGQDEMAMMMKQLKQKM